ncbi:MAG: 5-formyltetrahydrofolate cyclo-ligase [Galactobacter sp.]
MSQNPDESSKAAAPVPGPGTKADVRRTVRSERRRRAAVGHLDTDLTDAHRLARSAADVAGLVPGVECIGAYLAAPGEPDPAEAIAAWHAAGLRVLLPVSGRDRVLEWVEWTPSVRVAQGKNAPVPEPVGAQPAQPADLDLVVVPALQVGHDGTRLGQGGGYYDTFLAAYPQLPTVACVFADEVVAAVPSDPWDATLDAVWTEEGVRHLPL